MPTLHETNEFIKCLRYPKFASYVVGKLQKRFDLTRSEAVQLWEAYQEAYTKEYDWTKDEGFGKYLLFQIKFYLIEKSVATKDPAEKAWYQGGHLEVAKVENAIEDRHYATWQALKGAKNLKGVN